MFCAVTEPAPQAASCSVPSGLGQALLSGTGMARGLAVTCPRWSLAVLRVHWPVGGLWFRLCSLLQYLRTTTKPLETRALWLKQAAAAPSSAAEAGDHTMDLSEDKPNSSEAASTASPVSDTAAAGSNECDHAGYLSKGTHS